MIKVKVDKTEGMRKVGRKNRNSVKSWFLANPGMSVTDCSKTIGLAWPTAKRHFTAIQKGD